MRPSEGSPACLFDELVLFSASIVLPLLAWGCFDADAGCSPNGDSVTFDSDLDDWLLRGVMAAMLKRNARDEPETMDCDLFILFIPRVCSRLLISLQSYLPLANS